MLLAPYFNLANTNAAARSSVLLPFASDPLSCLAKSLQHGNLVVGVVSFTTVLGDFLPPLLANVPFNRAVAWDIHLVSTWLSIGILLLMLLVLLFLGVLATCYRPPIFPPLNLLRKCPVAVVLVLLGRSTDFVRQIQGLSLLSNSERDHAVDHLDLRYHIISTTDGSGGRTMRITTEYGRNSGSGLA
jgi:hypothetical protein